MDIIRCPDRYVKKIKYNWKKFRKISPLEYRKRFFI